jgi:serine/threonine protein kinase
MDPLNARQKEQPSKKTSTSKITYDNITIINTAGDGPQNHGMDLSHFEVGKLIGHGRYASVYLGTRHLTREKYAIKMVDKRQVTQSRMFPYVLTEKKIMFMLDHPNIVKLYWTFKDLMTCYFVSELCPKGELFDVIKNYGPLPPSFVRQYAAELVLVLEYIKTKTILHRDLKPENIFLSHDRHLKVGDWGTAKIMPTPAEAAEAAAEKARIKAMRTDDMTSSSSADEDAETSTARMMSEERKLKLELRHQRRTQRRDSRIGESEATSKDRQDRYVKYRRALKDRKPSFVGTPEYMAPEVLHNKDISYSADLW